MDPELRGIQMNELQLGSRILKYDGNDLVINDRAWTPVNIYDLVDPDVIVNSSRIESELCLSPPERIWTRLFSMGTLTRDIVSDIKRIDIIEPIKTVSGEKIISTPILPPNQPYSGELKSLIVNPVRGDDGIDRLKCSWIPEPVYRLATIGDGSCFFHAVLKGYYDKYQNDSTYRYRKELVKDLRSDLSKALSLPDPDHPGKNYYQTISDGTIAELGNMGIQLTDDFGHRIDYSLRGLESLLASESFIGDEIYSFVSSMLGVNVFILRATNTDLHIHSNTFDPKNPPRWSVIIVGNGVHYETLGVDRNGMIQTVFPPDDPILRLLKQ